ncbi:MAG: SIMPL domain-containing protein [Armatimonadota bacterium]
MGLSSSQKKILFTLFAFFMLSLIITALSMANWAYSRSSKPDSNRRIAVSDSATIKVRPDTAFITIGVTNKGRSASEVSRINAAKTSSVINAVIKTGVPKSDITTINFNIYPEMNYKRSPATVVGYAANNTVRIRTKNFDKLSKLIDASIAAGANNVREISFEVENKQDLNRKAIALAIKKATNKARTMAESVGTRLGSVISVSESINSYRYKSRNMSLNRAIESTVMSGETPIEPGEESISAEVEVVYSLR